MEVLDRFSGSGNLESWLFWAERYFNYLGFAEKDWLPLPSFYLHGEALNWFNWLFRNKQFLDWKHFKAKFAHHFGQQIHTDPMSSAFDSAYETGNSKVDHVFDKLPEQYKNVDSLALITGNTEIETPEDMETPQIGNAESLAVADLVQEPSSITKDQVLNEISQTMVSSAIPDLKVIGHEGKHSATTLTKVYDNGLCRDVSLQTKVLTAVLGDTRRSTAEEETNSRDNVALLTKSPQKDLSGFLVPFVSQGIVMSNASARIAGLAYQFDGTLWPRTISCLINSLCRVKHSRVLFYLIFSVHKSNWVDTGQEHYLPRLLLSKCRGCAREDILQEVITAFAEGYSKQYVVLDPGPYLDYVPPYAMEFIFEDGKYVEGAAVTIQIEPPDASEIFEGVTTRSGRLIAEFYDYGCVDGVELGIESCATLKTSCAVYQLLRESIENSPMCRFGGVTGHNAEQFNTPVVQSTGRFNDHHILNRFPFDPGANRRDPKLSSKFMALTSSTEKEEAHTLFEDLRKRGCLFSQLYDWQPVGGVEMGVECSCNFRNSCTSYKLLGESIAHSFLYSFDGAPTYLEEQYMRTQLRYFRSGMMWYHYEIAYLINVMQWLLIDQFRHLQSGKALELSMLYPDMASKLVICINVLVAAALVKMYTNNAQLDSAKMLFSKTGHEDEIIAIHATFFIWMNQRQKGVIMDFVQFISPKELRCAIISEHELTGSSLLSLNFWKMRLIHAPTIWSRYLLDIHQVPLILSGTTCNNVMFGKCYEPQVFSKAMQSSFLSFNWYLLMMESIVIFCAQRPLFKNSITNLLVGVTNALTLERIVQEAQVKCYPLNAKIVACCLMIYGSIVPKVVNVIVATITCHVAIDHIFSLYSPGYLCVETIGRVRTTNTSLDSNLEDKVLFEDGSIFVNQPYLVRDYGPEMRNEADPAGTIGPRAKGPIIEQPNRILVRYIWDPGEIRGMRIVE